MADYNVERLQEHFGDREFTGKDIQVLLGLLHGRESGSIIKSLKHSNLIQKSPNGWRFGSATANPDPTVEHNTVTTSAPMRRIGGYYFAERAVLIADTLQDGKVTIFTTILEIDGETKHHATKRLSSPSNTHQPNTAP